VFESLTGMQDLWEGEESILKFYSHSCPRLYELETIAYWIIEKGAHSNRLKAHINQIAQVAIELSIRRGKSTFSILKAHNRRPDSLNKPEFFWADGLTVSFDIDRPMPEKIDLGRRLKSLRTKQGVSQKELAGLVGVTPSKISQIESNLIYQSLPALIKIAQVMSVDVSFFFHKNKEAHRPVIFSGEGNSITFQNIPRGNIEGRQLLPTDLPAEVEPYIIEIAAEKKLTSHFFNHKGEEFGYLLEGELEVTIKNTAHIFTAGNIIFLAHDVPTQWKNNTDKKAVLLWMKIK
jgi:transcriptional regulator with XRE-family HTH domain